MTDIRKQNLTVTLPVHTLQKAKILAAKRGTSSGLVAAQIEALVNEDEAYERAHRAALELMNRGFHMGGSGPVPREQLHGRRGAHPVRRPEPGPTD